MLEVKMVLAVTVRRFQVRSAYDEWDRLHWGNRSGSKMVNGERAYPVLDGAAHPSEGLPCRVEMIAH